LLQARHSEIERAVLARVRGISDPTMGEDPQYAAGLRTAVSAGLRYGIAGIEAGAGSLLPIPPDLGAQARSAARNGVSLDTVLRRYFAGYALLRDYVLQAVEDEEIESDGTELQCIWRLEAALFDRLLAAMAEAYADETQKRLRGADYRRTEQVRRLLAGELLDLSELRYDFDAWHLGVLASGPGAQVALRELCAALDRSLLSVRSEGETIWAWMGGRRRLSSREVLSLAVSTWPTGIILALGEPGAGIDGWRLTHRQAKAALPIAKQADPKLTRYTDVALLASAIRDDVLANSLIEAYLAPLGREPDGGEALRQTLHAYFESGRNISSAAAALGLSRPTVKSRLDTIEDRIGRSLDTCSGEMETALRLNALSGEAFATLDSKAFFPHC
jgi:hypothetical protein